MARRSHKVMILLSLAMAALVAGPLELFVWFIRKHDSGTPVSLGRSLSEWRGDVMVAIAALVVFALAYMSQWSNPRQFDR